MNYDSAVAKVNVQLFGSKVDDLAKDLELDNNSVAGSEAASGLMAPMVSQSDVRTNLQNDYRTNSSNYMHNENRFDFITLIVKSEETPSCSLFPISSVGSPVRRLSGEFTATCLQTNSLPVGNMEAVNLVNTDHQSSGRMAFSGRSLLKMRLKELAGDLLEWPEWRAIMQSTVGRSSLSNDEKMSHLKTLLTGHAR